MDIFGIGAAIEGSVQIYLRTARSTGRSNYLVENIKDGDRVVFADPREANRVKRLCLERGLSVECIVVRPEDAYRLREYGPAKGRLMFDHVWVEMYYLHAIRQAGTDISQMQQFMSGAGAAEHPSQRAEYELRRWKF